MKAEILTTHCKRFHPAWTSRTVLLREFHEEAMRDFPRQLGPWRTLVWSWRLFRASRNYRGVLTGSERAGHGFAVLQALFRSRHKRIPHVMIDFPWAASPGKLKLAFKRLQMKIEAPAITRIIALAAPEEAERFAAALHVPVGKFTFIPYHHTLYGSNYQVSQGDYVFSGGDYRDYATLIKALDGLSVRAVICARRTDYFDGLSVPPGVEVFTAKEDEFDRLLAGSAVVIVPLPAGDIHTGGHTVIANAMTMGKPIIVAGREEYRAYVTNGVTGLLVSPGDVQALRNAIRSVLENPGLASELGRNAQVAAALYTPEAFFDGVFGIIGSAAPAHKNPAADEASMQSPGCMRHAP